MSAIAEMIEQWVATVTAPAWHSWQYTTDAAFSLHMAGSIGRDHLPRLLPGLERHTQAKRLAPLILAAGGMLCPFTLKCAYLLDANTTDQEDWTRTSAMIKQARADIAKAYEGSIQDDALHAVKAIARHLASPDLNLRCLSARALAKAGPNARPVLTELRAACHDSEQQVEIYARIACTNITRENDGTADYLLGIMRDCRRDESVANAAASAFSFYYCYGIDHTPYVPDLVEVVRSGNSEARVLAGLTVGWHLCSADADLPEVKLALPLLLEAMITASPELYGGLSGIFQTFGPAAVPYLNRILENRSLPWDKRVRVAGALGLIGPIASETLPLLKMMERDSEDPDHKRIVHVAIGRIEGTQGASP